MPAPCQSSFVSPQIYAHILSSPDLKNMLLPEGLIRSPYEILDYDATLTLENPGGTRATFQRQQQVRFLQDGVSGILDHFWGDGIMVTLYDNRAGSLQGSFRDGRKCHVVVGLRRPMHSGETLGFEVTRKAVVSFTKHEEWVETKLDHPSKQLSRSIIFPKDRPCQMAKLHMDRRELPLPIIRDAQGRTLIQFKIDRPIMDASYIVRWSW